MQFETTICAPATSGSGAISVIRISGPDTFRICDLIGEIPGSRGKLSGQKGNTLHYGKVYDNGSLLDEVVFGVFKKPHSYTGEDSIEISCHASPFIRKRILELLVENGAKLAGPGEFTQRAFLNGKMDLHCALFLVVFY